MTKQPPRLPLSYEYHDGAVLQVDIGPRHEVVIHIRLDPVWNEGDDSVRRLRFSAIRTFDDVVVFFRRQLPPEVSGAAVDEVVAILRLDKGVVGLELSKLGVVEIHTSKVMEF